MGLIATSQTSKPRDFPDSAGSVIETHEHAGDFKER
jgi:hypothetical protein